MTPVSKIMSLFLIVVFTAGAVWMVGSVVAGKNDLQVLGNPGHVAGSFSFTNQQGKQVTEKDVLGKVTVAEYFFTRCAGICPIMSQNLSRVYDKYKDRSDFVILSHSVDPERDSVPVMAKYASRFHAAPPGWEFLTGDKYALYKAARQDYLLSLDDSPNVKIEDDFIHTEYVTLLDKQRKIRGFYNATDSSSLDKMIEDIGTLLKKDLSSF